jgi:hypothetical protein
MNKQKGIATRPSNRCRSRREERLPALLGGRSFERAASKTKSSRRLRSETPHRSAVLRQRINGACKGKCRTLRVQQDQGRWLFPLHGQIKSRRRTPARGRGQAEIIRRPPQLGNRDKSAITLVASDTRYRLADHLAKSLLGFPVVQQHFVLASHVSAEMIA